MESNINSNLLNEMNDNGNKLVSGNEVIDELTGGFEKDTISTIYGPAGSGKTNFCILAAIAAIEKGKKVVYVDTDGSFSVDRMRQITPDYVKCLENMIFFKPMSFQEQKIAFDNLHKLIGQNIGLIIVDSIAMLYRLQLGNENDIYNVNRELGKQITTLTQIARQSNIPILITNQVYSAFDGSDDVKMVGGNFLNYGSKCLIEIKEYKNQKQVILRKHRSLPTNIKVDFRIVEKGVEIITE